MNLARLLALCLVVAGLLLLIRLTAQRIASSPPPAVGLATAAAPPDTQAPAVVTLAPAPTLGPTPGPAATRPAPSAGPRITTAPATLTSAPPSPETTAALAESPAALRPSPAATASERPALTATASATTVAPTVAPTAAAQIVNNQVEPAWWPCAQGETKGLPKLGSYYPPPHPDYSRIYVGVTCFPSIEAAVAAGLSEAPPVPR